MGLVADKINDILEAIFIWMWESLSGPFDGNVFSLKELVFGRTKDGDLVWGTFQPTDLTEAFTPLYYSVATLSGFVLVAFIVIHGMRITSSGLNPNQRNEMIKFFYDLLIIMFVLLNLTTFYDLLFQMNQGVVGLFNGSYESNLDNMKDAEMDSFGGVIGWLLVQLVLLGLGLWANFYYFMRKVTLILLMAMGPLMLMFYLNPKFKGMTGAWTKELIGSIFIQSIHAFVFWTVAVLSANSNGLIETVILYAIFIPISESLRGLLGMGGGMQGGLNKAGAMMGMAALSGMYGAAKGALGDQSVMGAMKGAYDGVKGKGKGKGSESENGEAKDTSSSIGASAGDLGTSSRAEKMLRAGDIMSKAGKASFGAAGAIAGMGLGPIGSMAGATLGSVSGGIVGGLTGRAGAVAVQAIPGIKNQLAKGAAASEMAKNGFSPDNLDNNLASSIADRSTTSWADENKESVMNAFKEKFPDATPKEAEAHFNSVQAQKREGFLQDAKSNVASLKAKEGQFASGNSMVNASAEAMASQWGNDNQKSFNDAYDKENLQSGQGYTADYLAKRSNAFNGKKAEMKKAFTDAGNQFVSQNAVNGIEPISKDAFQEHMSGAVAGISGVGDTGKLVQAGNQAVAHVTGASVIGAKGKPNESFIVGQLAASKTNEMKDKFVGEQMAQGVSKNSATQNWMDNHQQTAHANNVQSFQGSLDQASQGIKFRSNPNSTISKASDLVSQTGAFVSGATGYGSLKEVVSSASQGAVAGYKTNSNAGFKTQMSSAIKGGIEGGANQIVEQQGGAVEAQAKLQNIVGYTAGAMLGPKGYQIGKKASLAMTPFKSQVQEEIQSVSEVIQMARTTTDPNGNTQIAPGAVRQVITRDASYIEVQTKSGTTQTVSRKGAGHSTLKQGEVVYQDLQAVDDSLVVAQSKGGQSSTYRLDSGGGRIPSRVQVSQNPTTLLSDSVQGSVKAAPVQKNNLPIFNQKVDSGNFTVEDLQGMSNPQVVMEKNRQFVTAQKEGVTYRVSPVYAGDTRLGSAETINIPVQVNGSQLQATKQVSPVSVGTSSGTPYYSSKSIEGLVVGVGEMMHSKHEDHANRSVEKREALDRYRRKQGLLG